jgi:CheY-like chemotaxis protein
MQMPDMDGEAVGRAIHADARLVDTRTLLLTSLGVRYGSRHYEQIGFRGCAAKPLRRDELRNLLSMALSNPGSAHSESARTAPLDWNHNLVKPFAAMNARILIADDNATNREVGLNILRKLGLSADAVADGAEALKSLESIPYDLVLMDVRMPVMDGMEATRQIRNSHSAVLNHNIPIIAMTANAMKSDEESCLAAGMNGFVPKPVSTIALQNALKKWLPVVDTQIDAQIPAAADQLARPRAEEDEPVVFDRAGVLARLEGDKELAMVVIEAFLEDAPRQIQELKNLAMRGDSAASGRLAHSIRGAAANVGGERLRKVATEMEKAADSGNLDAVNNHMAELEAQFLLLQDAIQDAPCRSG